MFISRQAEVIRSIPGIVPDGLWTRCLGCEDCAGPCGALLEVLTLPGAVLDGRSVGEANVAPMTGLAARS